MVVNQADDGSSPFSSAKINFGVWCNVSIRVLGTRGDSLTLSTPTIRIAFASLVQLVQDTAPPALGHRFESGTMLQYFSGRDSSWQNGNLSHSQIIDPEFERASEDDVKWKPD